MPAGGGAYPLEDVESGKMLAILGLVISPLWIIPLVTRDNAFSLYHAKQALVLNIVGAVVAIVVTVVTAVTCGVGAVLYVLFLPLMYPWIIGIVNILNGQYQPMPWIGSFGESWFAGIQADKRPGQLPPGGQQ